MNIRRIAADASIVLAVALSCTSAFADNDQGERFTFALWGDMPYVKNGDNSKIPALINSINAANVDFTVFDGDIKDGSSICADTEFAAAIDRFNAFRGPMIYVPGDNEWTDCHRTNNGGYNNLERLAHLRAIMFSIPYSYGQRPMKLEHQGPLGGVYAENTRWHRGRVTFVGLNVPGSNNNKVDSDADCTTKSVRTLADCAADNAEYAARDAANIAFLHETFRKAKTAGDRGVMVVIQADPSFDLPETESVDERTLPGVDGYDNFLAALVDETNNFNGQVVLVHGDTHFFKIDKPLLDQAHMLKNFTRVETFGSPNAHWVKVTVDPRNANIFHFDPMMVPGN